MLSYIFWSNVGTALQAVIAIVCLRYLVLRHRARRSVVPQLSVGEQRAQTFLSIIALEKDVFGCVRSRWQWPGEDPRDAVALQAARRIHAPSTFVSPHYSGMLSKQNLRAQSGFKEDKQAKIMAEKVVQHKVQVYQEAVAEKKRLAADIDSYMLHGGKKTWH